MIVHVLSASPRVVSVSVPAKINSYLAVGPRRADGYHPVDTVLLPVGLRDRLTVRAAAGDALSLRISGATGIPADATNTVLRAALALRESCPGTRPPLVALSPCPLVPSGAAFRLRKRIPAGAGLGGGSADAAAALIALDRLWACGLSRRPLSRIGASIGSDVPFFLGDGAARARGRGERLTPAVCRGPFPCVIVHPGFALSTPRVYQAFDRLRRRRRPLGDGIHRILTALAGGDAAALAKALRNDLEPAALRVAPRLKRVRAALERHPFLGVAMTGSGSAYFGLCRTAAEARRLARDLAEAGVGRVWAVEAG